MVWRRISPAAALLLCLVHAQQKPLERFEATEPHMGTLFRIVLYAADAERAQAAFRPAFDRIAELDNRLSDYNPQSELMRMCREAYRKPVHVSADLFRVLAHAQNVARDSEGAFDVTLGPVIRLWREARKEKRLPAPEDIAQARKAVG